LHVASFKDHAPLVASFASGVAKDEAAVRAAITSPWSSGQTAPQARQTSNVKPQQKSIFFNAG
jgi:hypothetical protein